MQVAHSKETHNQGVCWKHITVITKKLALLQTLASLETMATPEKLALLAFK